ncbi:Sulfate anion transporter 1 [Thelohanellus kitauei]|uniref:Sulfate anion transporter 1 n=1 Tax=Thelohanellus kitauei TaxID=669202 RepID=A0A0C2JPK2_THEKT|nr:Sulfate anion transporter 1 [Thelohanellus kitauei]
MDIDIKRNIYLETDLNPSRVSTLKIEKTRFLSHINIRLTSIQILDYLSKWFPVISWLPNYQLKSFLKHDIICGLTSGILSIPYGLAVAQLSNLPAVSGLYMSFICPLIYMVTGSSKHLTLCAFSIVCEMIGAVLETEIPLEIMAAKNHSITSEQAKYMTATTLTFMVGLFQIFLSIIRFGFLSNLMSSTVTNGFLFGAAILILSSQISFLSGVQFKSPDLNATSRFVETYIQFFRHRKGPNYVELLIGLTSLIVAISLRFLSSKLKKHIKIPIPSELLIIILSGSLSHALKLKEKYGVRVVGRVPSGLPGFILPDFGIMRKLLKYVFPLALVQYGCSVSVAKSLADKYDEKIRYDTVGLCST